MDNDLTKAKSSDLDHSLREAVRVKYAEVAASVKGGGGSCGCGPEDAAFGESQYGAREKNLLPEDAKVASLGCGNPTVMVSLSPGDVVLDLGSGGGIDVLLSAKRVAPNGLAVGLDMTDEMLDLAMANAREAGVHNVIFLRGTIEDIPLPRASVDVVISNCVINLSVDKAKVLAEIARVLRPGGKVAISDVVAEDQLSESQRQERGSYVGCIAGALSKSEYQAGLTSIGLTDVEVTFTYEVADAMHGAIISGRKPEALAPQPH